MAEILETRKKRVALIQPMVNEGLKPIQISQKLGINAETVRHIIRRYCVRPEGYVNPRLTGESLMDWQSEADPSILTEEQKAHAKRVGITEGRYAWMVLCPRINHPQSHPKHG